MEHPLSKSLITGIELDIQLTSDDQIPVLHDTTIALPDGSNYSVADHTFSETDRILQQKHGAGFPGLADLPSTLSLINHATELNLEVKTGTYTIDRFTGILSDHLSAYNPADDIIISSFSFDTLEYLRRHLAKFNLRYAFIFFSSDDLALVPDDVRSRFDLLHPHYRLPLEAPHLFTDTTPIRCWTVNEIPVMAQIAQCCTRLPVEAVMTDNLAEVASFGEQFPD